MVKGQVLCCGGTFNDEDAKQQKDILNQQNKKKKRTGREPSLIIISSDNLGLPLCCHSDKFLRRLPYVLQIDMLKLESEVDWEEENSSVCWPKTYVIWVVNLKAEACNTKIQVLYVGLDSMFAT
ncbi:hypothetical protein GOBAR_AA21672 [Gossypium barbadense]|uniref:Uncharacterized protein n=1 Tax=Gossypium barbadense TaxID=3634 RepID=A0A2P5X6N2_GOSBA|nr:hypothetical protein GOBAR_AA21672 [Gossypium barbadense]